MIKPKTICIELVTQCNALCAYCPLGRTVLLPYRYLRLSTLSAIVKMIPKSWSPQIELGGFGESLLHKHLPRIVSQIKSLRPDLRIATSTNGLLLSLELLTELDRSGLDEITISINSVAKDGKIRYRQPTQYLKPIINLLKKARKSLRILRISIQLFAHKNGEEVELAREIRKYVDLVYIKKVSNWNSLVKVPNLLLENNTYISNYYKCSWYKNSIMLDAAGFYALCCVHLSSPWRKVSIYQIDIETYWKLLINKEIKFIFPDLTNWCCQCTNGTNQYFLDHFEVVNEYEQYSNNRFSYDEKEEAYY